MTVAALNCNGSRYSPLTGSHSPRLSLTVFPSSQGSASERSSRSRARRKARRSEPLTARTVLTQSGNRERPWQIGGCTFEELAENIVTRYTIGSIRHGQAILPGIAGKKARQQ